MLLTGGMVVRSLSPIVVESVDLAIMDGRDPRSIDEEMRAPMRVTSGAIRSTLRSVRPGPGMVVIAY